jgi:hypothetical protein
MPVHFGDEQFGPMIMEIPRNPIVNTLRFHQTKCLSFESSLQKLVPQPPAKGRNQEPVQ